MTLQKTAYLLLIILCISCHSEPTQWTAQITVDGDASSANIATADRYNVPTPIDTIAIQNHQLTLSDKAKILQKYHIEISGYPRVILFARNGDNIQIHLSDNGIEYKGNEVQEMMTKLKQIDYQKSELLYKLRQTQNELISKEESEDQKAATFQKLRDQKANQLLQSKITLMKTITDKEFLSWSVTQFFRGALYTWIDDANLKDLTSLFTKEVLSIEGADVAYDMAAHYRVYKLYKKATRKTYGELNQEFEKLSQGEQASIFGQKTNTILQNLKRTAKGSPAPIISSKDIEGNAFSSKDINAKILIIDFWASWCPPCHKENVDYVKLYNTYHSKGLEILGYSIDTKGERWKKAVKNDKLTWIQASNLEGYTDAIAKDYTITSIPTNFVVVNGIIVEKNVFGEELRTLVAKYLK